MKGPTFIALHKPFDEINKDIEEMNDLRDADSADILTEISRGVDKWLWFVKAHQQGQEAAR